MDGRNGWIDGWMDEWIARTNGMGQRESKEEKLTPARPSEIIREPARGERSALLRVHILRRADEGRAVDAHSTRAVDANATRAVEAESHRSEAKQSAKSQKSKVRTSKTECDYMRSGMLTMGTVHKPTESASTNQHAKTSREDEKKNGYVQSGTSAGSSRCTARRAWTPRRRRRSRRGWRRRGR